MKSLAIFLAMTAGAWCTAAGEIGTSEPLLDPLVQHRLELAAIETEARSLDPDYAALKLELEVLTERLLQLHTDLGLEIDGEGAILGPIPAPAQAVLDRVNEVAAAIDLTEGHRHYVYAAAEAARSGARSRDGSVALKVTSKHFNLQVYRDPSVPTSSYSNSLLVGYVDAAMGGIRSAILSASGGNYDISWTTTYSGTAYLYGCGAPSASGGSGVNFKVYFRRGESSNNGWGWTGSHAVIDLTPGCSSGAWDWDNVIITIHELGHVFSADHAPSSCTDYFNDRDCGSIECGFDFCDLFTACVMEYADGGTGTSGFCGDDKSKMYSFVQQIGGCQEPAPYNHLIQDGSDSHYCHAPYGYQRATCNNGSWTNFRGLCPE